MEEAIVILDSDEEEDGGRVTAARSSGNGVEAAIDLTRNHCELDDAIIDLTATEDNLQLSSSFSIDDASDSSSDEDTWNLSPSTSGSQSLCSSEWSEATSKGALRTAESDISSPEDPSNAKLQRDIFASTTKKCLLVETNSNLSNNSIPLEDGPMPAASSSGGDGLHDDTFNVSSQSHASSPSSSSTIEETETQGPQINRAFLYKLRYFKKPPVSHFFHKSPQQEKSLSPKPIPVSRMGIMNNTKEENFHQSTLHFLTEFLSAHHYPPKDIVMHVIQSVLLGPEEEAIKNESYMVLMKVQKLHPATLDTVAWDWSLLKEVMDRKEYQSSLFLQYVVQTLDDDFQTHLQRRIFKKSLCSTMLSCDKCSGNVKNVIAWLMDAVENACDDDGNLGTRSTCAQRVLFLLQRMLTIAVEVDNLPVTSSIRIADLLFPSVIVLKTRQQREMFLSSTENHLLRAKILELVFLNSCETQPPQELPLSLYKILHFIGNSSLLLENQGPEWQRWDEILCHIFLLFFSFQRISIDHLQTPVVERADEILRKPCIKLPLCEDVTEADVERHLNHFWTRTGSEAPATIKDHFDMLKALLLTEVNRHTPQNNISLHSGV